MFKRVLAVLACLVVGGYVGGVIIVTWLSLTVFLFLGERSPIKILYVPLYLLMGPVAFPKVILLGAGASSLALFATMKLHKAKKWKPIPIAVICSLVAGALIILCYRIVMGESFVWDMWPEGDGICAYVALALGLASIGVASAWTIPILDWE